MAIIHGFALSAAGGSVAGLIIGGALPIGAIVLAACLIVAGFAAYPGGSK